MRLPSYDPKGPRSSTTLPDMSWNELLALWATYNQFLAHVLAAVPPDKLSTPCYVGENPGDYLPGAGRRLPGPHAASFYQLK